MGSSLDCDVLVPGLDRLLFLILRVIDRHQGETWHNEAVLIMQQFLVYCWNLVGSPIL